MSCAFLGFPTERAGLGGPSRYAVVFLSLILLALIFSSCATPNAEHLSNTTVLNPDEDDNLGGTFFESGDIRTIATRMSAEILSTQQIYNSPVPVRIVIAPIKNRSRFLLDPNIFMRRLRIELNRISAGRIRFFLGGDIAKGMRKEMFKVQDEAMWDNLISIIADYIVKSPVIASAHEPPTIAVIPVRNTNLLNVNAESLTALIRAKISEKANGKVQFLAREKNGKVIEEILDEQDIKSMGLVKSRRLRKIYGADYFLSGEFIGKSLSTVKIGKEDNNIDKYLNVMLIDAETGAIPVEKIVKVSRKVNSPYATTDLILSGELSGLSKRAAGARSDYLLMSFQLVDPITNEILWEDAYETKKKTGVGVIYQ